MTVTMNAIVWFHYLLYNCLTGLIALTRTNSAEMYIAYTSAYLLEAASLDGRLQMSLIENDLLTFRTTTAATPCSVQTVL